MYVGELAYQLARKGYEVDIFTRWEHAQLPQVVQWRNGVRVVHIKAGPVECIPKEQLLPYMADFRENMLAFMRNEQIQYDLIHANFFMSALVALELKAILHVPFVVTFHALGHVRRIHQGEQDKFPPERLDIESSAIKLADYIIAECPQDREDLIKYYNAPPDKIRVVPCGVNTEEMFPVDQRLARMKLKLPQDDFVLLQLGRMVQRKGVDNVIRALTKLRYTGTRIRLIIVGGEDEVCGLGYNPEIARLKQLAKELGVQHCVTFAGRKGREELKYYYAAADIFITTPWYEPFGITPLEAMACGTAVIGADVGGIKYSILDGKTGLLVPPKDPQALADKINELLMRRPVLEEMGRNGIKRVQALFTWERVAQLMSRLYDKAIASNDIALSGTMSL